MAAKYLYKIFMAELPYLKANLYTQVITECFSGLKGQNIIAQGRVSGGTIRNAALGKGEGGETVRWIKLFKMIAMFRTELSK